MCYIAHRVSGKGEKDKDEKGSPGQFNAGPPLVFVSVAKRESVAQLCHPLPLGEGDRVVGGGGRDSRLT